MKLKKVLIHKYKCIESSQEFEVKDDVTILVGMNESGKTSVLEAIAKSNYFQNDPKFKFNKTHDYPRKQKKALDKSKEDPEAITCEFELDQNLLNSIETDLGKGVFSSKTISKSVKYSNFVIYNGIKIDFKKFIDLKTKTLGISSAALNEKLLKVKNPEELKSLINEYKDEDYKTKLKSLEKYFANEWEWVNDPIGEYVARKHIGPNIPKFLYYDEYYSLPSRISIEKLQQESLEYEELKTARALFELADINIEELVKSADFEDYKAELEATEANITEELFKYWHSNQNLDISFDIDKIENTHPQQGTRIIEHVLDIRVRNNRSKVSLPLKNRSKGFNWFFSFLVWFKKIQEDKTSNYVLLLDEPGLNLHASAQKDLLDFIKDLSRDYQILYTTHSPFMIPSSRLDSVRTVVEQQNGSFISDSVQEKDPNTLFPLQAALGYDIAQNLFISEKNLLVEGVSDLVYLQVLSSILQKAGKQGLNEEITIVPTGGLDKVGTFISLLRGSQLKIVCLLDTFRDPKGKAKLDDMIRNKIIHEKKIRFFHEFVNEYSEADLEDLFVKEDYLKLFNGAFHENVDISIGDLNSGIKPIILQINTHLSKNRFNHYRPANYLASVGADEKFLSNETLNNFEKVFEEVNRLFE